jgi:hypothetical protein
MIRQAIEILNVWLAVKLAAWPNNTKIVTRSEVMTIEEKVPNRGKSL